VRSREKRKKEERTSSVLFCIGIEIYCRDRVRVRVKVRVRVRA
jgi:hypothetical protein